MLARFFLWPGSVMSEVEADFTFNLCLRESAQIEYQPSQGQTEGSEVKPCPGLWKWPAKDIGFILHRPFFQSSPICTQPAGMLWK